MFGPTAAGKTNLAIKTYDYLPIEIISVDSVMVYKKCDVGSAKPSKEILKQYPHHLVDVETLNNIFSVADFLNLAKALIEEIHDKNKIPFFVGGSMMYFRSLFYGIHDLPGRDLEYRKELNEIKQNNSTSYLYKMLEGIDPNYAVDIDHNDEIRIIRALEIYKNSGKKLSEIFSNNPTNGIKEKYEVIQFGIKTDRGILHERIKARLHEMIDKGLIEETENILNDFNISESHPIRKAVNYKQSIEYINGKYPKDILFDKALYATRQLAKRQVTWMKSWDDYINVDIEDIKTFTNKVKNSLSSL